MPIQVVELSNTSAKLAKNQKRGKTKIYSKRFLIGLGIFLALLIILFLFLFPHGVSFVASLKETLTQAKKVQDQVSAQNIIEVREQATALKEDLTKTRAELGFWGFLKFIPVLNNYYNDALHLLNAGSLSRGAVMAVSDALIPFADSLGLNGGSAGASTEENVSKFVQIIPKILTEVDKLQETLSAIKKEISPIDPKRYPEEYSGFKIRSSLTSFRDYVVGLEKFAPELKPILKNLPEALGESKPKTYLVLLQNNAELRSTGGFITSVAYMKLIRGQISSVKSEDVYRIDERIKDHPLPPEYLNKYLKVDKFYIRDANISPDFITSMDQFRALYEQSTDKVDFDGFIALDTEFVRNILQVTGPITTTKYKETFSSELNKDGISDVVYKLELYSQKLLIGQDDRKELLGDLLNSLLNAVLRTPGSKWQTLMQSIGESTRAKHLMFYSFDPNTQKLLEKYDLSGKIKDYDKDYLHINQNNYGGLKSNLFITETIEQDIEVKDNGEITKTVSLHLNNSKKGDGWLNGTYHDLVRFMMPVGSELQPDTELGIFEKTNYLNKANFVAYTNLEPLSSTTVTIKYKLPFRVYKGEEYKMLIQKQPGTKDQQIIIRVNGKEVVKDKLSSDKEYKFTI